MMVKLEPRSSELQMHPLVVVNPLKKLKAFLLQFASQLKTEALKEQTSEVFLRESAVKPSGRIVSAFYSANYK